MVALVGVPLRLCVKAFEAATTLPRRFLKIICRFAGEISPCLWVDRSVHPRKRNVKCDKAQDYENQIQTISSSTGLRCGAWNWIVFPSGPAVRDGGFGPHRARENFAGQYASLSRSNQFRPRPAARRLRLRRSQVSMALAGRAAGVSSISVGPVNLIIGLLSICAGRKLDTT